VITTVPAGNSPQAVAVNQVTNKSYVANHGTSNPIVINGATDATTAVKTGGGPFAIAANQVTNKIRPRFWRRARK